MQYVGDTAEVYSKKISNDKSYVQLNIVGYNYYFSFSDWYWSYQKYGPSNTGDESQYFNTSIKKDKWEYDNEGIHEWSSENGEEKDWAEFRDFSIQKGFPNYLKTISLVKDTKSLEKQLRLTSEDEQKYNSYFERVEGTTLTSDELKKLKPWSESFNQKVIEEKLNLKDHDYLFV
ncbi:hypothetical protein CJJ23_04350 [Mycoplasmopsis agassizii]|uniref:Uncharacterized protein n=1 Tax=Mycoplasmopsis agassizii TaxID=33922 RepID=A0A269THS2_9BACT|nr:hypothetical protein [Mycoplasmopsis agassizii]PAK21009.1 hypothetical protein CJJ23_04350 [Mycoplasmopsis agassizii]